MTMQIVGKRKERMGERERYVVLKSKHGPKGGVEVGAEMAMEAKTGLGGQDLRLGSHPSCRGDQSKDGRSEAPEPKRAGE